MAFICVVGAEVEAFLEGGGYGAGYCGVRVPVEGGGVFAEEVGVGVVVGGG